MSLTQVSNSSPGQSIPFSILDLKSQAVRIPVSKGAQILLSELLTWSGERRYCWWSIPKIAKDLGWSVSSVWRRSAELQDAHLLKVIPRAGRSNYWVPLPGRNRMERLKKELAPLATTRVPFLKENEKLKRCTVKTDCASTDQAPPPPINVNAAKISFPEVSPLQRTTPDTPINSIQEPIPVVQHPPYQPIQQKPTPPVMVPNPKSKTQPPLTPEHLFLVQEIERITGDTWSRGHFINLVRQVDEQTIYAALSITREKRSLESGVNLGAYFTATVKGLTGLASLGGKCPGGSITQQSCPDTPMTTPPARPTPRFLHPDEPEPVDPDALKKGWRLQYKASGIQALLSLVQRCVPVSVDVRSLWGDVQAALPETKESFAVDRFLDTVVTRMKHAERMAEG